MQTEQREVALLQEKLGTTTLELEKVKGKYSALNKAYRELLEQLFGNDSQLAIDSEGNRHIFYSEDDVK